MARHVRKRFLGFKKASFFDLPCKNLRLGFTDYRSHWEIRQTLPSLFTGSSNLFQNNLRELFEKFDFEIKEDVAHNLIVNARSQLGQEIFVLSELGYKHDGYFVEFGACDGLHFSNSYFFEVALGWNGILSEPSDHWNKNLRRNRNVHINKDAVWKRSDEILEFNAVNRAALSTLSLYNDSDFHSEARKDGTEYTVKTISLLDLLRRYDAPELIDYISIDTEGSEFDILDAFDFTKYRFKTLTVEHNHTGQRDKIKALLESHGYQRKWTEYSGCDDWYVHPDYI